MKRRHTPIRLNDAEIATMLNYLPLIPHYKNLGGDVLALKINDANVEGLRHVNGNQVRHHMRKYSDLIGKATVLKIRELRQAEREVSDKQVAKEVGGVRLVTITSKKEQEAPAPQPEPFSDPCEQPVLTPDACQPQPLGRGVLEELAAIQRLIRIEQNIMRKQAEATRKLVEQLLKELGVEA